MNPIGYSRQWIVEADVDALQRAARSEWLTAGPGVAAFEEAFASAAGTAPAAVVSSGTAALHLAVLALGARPGRVGLVPAITFAATANALLYAGARPEFVDVDPATGLMDLDAASAALRAARARGDARPFVLPVHLAGLPVDMPRLWEWAGREGLTVIEDACHAPGATYEAEAGRRLAAGAGPHSHAATFSFHPVKHLTTGEGGAVTSADPEVLRRVRMLRSHGIERDPARMESPSDGPWAYEVQHLGFNYRLPDLTCALGESQCARLSEGLAARRRLAARYGELFRQTGLSPEHVQLPLEPLGRESAWHLYVIHLRGALASRRSEVWAHLRSRGIGTQVHYVPLPRMPLYRRLLDVKAASYPGAEEYYEGCLSIPLFPTLSASDQERVVEALLEVRTAASGAGR